MGGRVSFGQWRVASTTSAEVPKKVEVEIVLDDEALILERSGGPALRIPADDAFARVDGPRKVVVMARDGSRVWLEAQGSATSEGLPAALSARKTPAPEEPAGDLDLTQPVLIISYPGRTQADAAQAFAAHSRELVAAGYTPTSQSWGEGRPGAARVLALGIYANSIRPDGYLTVTYVRRDPVAAPAEPKPDPIDQIRRLGELRDAGLVSPEEFEAKRLELLARI